MLFQGEEWGASTPFQYFTDHQDPELGRAVSEGRRREFAAFGWSPEEVPDPQDPATFARSKLDWAESGREPHASILEWHRRLIALRRTHEELTDGRLDLVDVEVSESCEWLRLRRGRITVAVNLSPRPQEIAVPEGSEIILASDHQDVSISRGDTAAVHLPPDTVVVLTRA